MDVDRPVGQAIGIKEALAMDLERYGTCGGYPWRRSPSGSRR